jgi:hypothetical protein
MKTTKCALAWTAVLLAALSPLRSGAQPRVSAGMMAQAAQAEAEGLAPSEIIASVRSAGFDPLSRPVQRGGVYVLFAIDGQYMEVRVTVDPNNGRVLSATRLAGMRYGGPGYDGHEVLTRYERPPVPPADIPNRGAGRSSGPAASSPPLPRARPSDSVAGSSLEAAPQAQAEPRAAAPPAGPVETTVEASPRPRQPAMVPVAPLE